MKYIKYSKIITLSLFLFILIGCANSTEKTLSKAQKISNDVENTSISALQKISDELESIFNNNPEVKNDESNQSIYHRILAELNIKKFEVEFNKIKENYNGDLQIMDTGRLFNYQYEVMELLKGFQLEGNLPNDDYSHIEDISNELDNRKVDYLPDEIYARRWELTEVEYKDFIEGIKGKIVHWDGHINDVRIGEDLFSRVKVFEGRPYIDFVEDNQGVQLNLFIYGQDDVILKYNKYDSIEIEGIIYDSFDLFNYNIYVMATYIGLKE